MSEKTHRAVHFTTVDELQRAAVAQRALWPPFIYTGCYAEVAATTRPCEAVGGDFFDYVDTGREFRAVLGDVCGKGAPAALQAALVQGILAIEEFTDGGPACIITHLNRLLCRRLTPGSFVTLFYGIMTPERRLTYCNAGQCRPMLVNQRSVRRLSAGGLPPGLFGGAVYEEESLTLETGDTLVVFSDGISEAAGGKEEFGDRRILEIVKAHPAGPACAILDRIIADVLKFTVGRRQHDDMTALVVRYLA